MWKLPKLSGEIKEFNPKITNIFVNKVSGEIMEEGISKIDSTIIPILNGYIQNNLEIKFPTVMGISFTNISLEVKNKYIVINYDITRNKAHHGGNIPPHGGNKITDYCKRCKNYKSFISKLICKKRCRS